MLCYDPSAWLERANHLRELGYSELAAGDAYKARLLVQANLDLIRGKSTELGRRVAANTPDFLKGVTERLHASIFQLLVSLLKDLNEPSGLQALCIECREICPSDLSFQIYLEDALKMSNTIRSGRRAQYADPEFEWTGWTHLEQYPFIPPKYMKRNEEDICAARNALEFVSSNCSIIPRTFSNGSSSQAAGFGIYATADVKPFSHLFSDETIFGATDTKSVAVSAPGRLEVCEKCCGILPLSSQQRVKAKCCSAVYCSEVCRSMASDFYHQAVCGQDFDWLLEGIRRTPEGSQAMDGPLWLRVLSTCIQSDCHPLDHPLIARLVPQWSTNMPRKWTLLHNIIRPNRILQQLGVNIFQDLRYDTWVLQNVGARLKTNQNMYNLRDGRRIRAVNPLYSFLNHSCEPNATWRPAPIQRGATAHESTTMAVFAIKSIKKGDEICIDYDGVSQYRDKATRQKALWKWLSESACQCTRCQREG